MIKENRELSEKNVGLERKVSELEIKLNQNSKNSHLPPSSDKHALKIKAAFERKKSGRNGGQPGHQGNTLEKREFVNEIIELKADKCTCGQCLKGVRGELSETRQEMELPRIAPWVNEYQLFTTRCPRCGGYNQGTFPAGITAPTQYGSRFKAFCCMLNTVYKIPMKKLQELMEGLVGMPINESTIHQINKKAFQYLEKTEEQLKDRLLHAETIHVDETGVESGKKLEWGHVISNGECTLIQIHPKRGGDAILEESSILWKFKGRIIHDCFSIYFQLILAIHGICGAHLLRELQAQIEIGKSWASQMHQYLLEIKGNTCFANKKSKTSILRKYCFLLNQGKKEEPPPIRTGTRGRDKKSKGLNLIQRMLDYKNHVLAYAFDPLIPFTNNQAERDLRHLKVKLKVSGRFRSYEGSRCYARITSFTSTLQKNGLNMLDGLTDLFQNRNYEFNWC